MSVHCFAFVWIFSGVQKTLNNTEMPPVPETCVMVQYQ